MLVAVLNTCTQEELAETEEEHAAAASAAASSERRRVIRNKILAVGRVARVFSVLRYVHSCPPCHPHFLRLSADSEESERVSELKNVSGNAKLPYGTLASGAQGLTDA